MSEPQQPEIPSFEDERRDRLADQIKMISDNLGQVAAGDRPRLAVRIFEGIFLPYFAGDEKRAYPQADVGWWVGRVAGNPYQEVDVVDNAGEVLFTVPPMLDRTAVDAKLNGQGAGVAHIVASAQQYALLSPMAGSNYLQAELTKKALIMRVPANVVGHLQRWNAIFERFGRPPLLPLEAQDTPAASASEPKAPESKTVLLDDMDLL